VAKSILSRLAAAFVVTLATAADAQTSVDLTLPQARIIAAQAVTAGDFAVAGRLADLLIEADPQDRDAWLIRAAALLDAGDATAARRAAATAYGLSTEPIDRYEAARLAALAAANEGRFTLGEFWLRRALTVAPDEAVAAQTRADGAGLRRRNPLSFDVDLSLAPSDNVNGGSEFNVILINGQPVRDQIFAGPPIVRLNAAPDLALPGWVGVVTSGADYRLTDWDRSRLTAGFDVYLRAIRFDDEAEAILADYADFTGNEYDASDYFSGRATASLDYDRLVTNGSWGAGFAAGGVWSGQNLSYSFARLGFDTGVALTPTDRLLLATAVERRLRADDEDDTAVDASVGWLTALPGGDIAGLTFSAARLFSDDPRRANVAYAIQARYIMDEPVGPALLSGSLGYQRVDYEDYAIRAFGPDIPIEGGRQDDRVFGRVEAVFVDYTYAGFAPVVTLDYERRESNDNRFSSEGANIAVGLRSTF